MSSSFWQNCIDANLLSSSHCLQLRLQEVRRQKMFLFLQKTECQSNNGRFCDSPCDIPTDFVFIGQHRKSVHNSVIVESGPTLEAVWEASQV